MRKIAFIIMTVVLLGVGGVVAQNALSPFESKPSIVYDFSSVKEKSVLTKDAWDFFVGEPVYNDEQEVYTNSQDNVWVENGLLYIRAIKTVDGYTSAKISPMKDGERVGFQGGKFEIVAQMPTGAGTWPAFWLLSLDEKYTKGLSDIQWENDPNLWAKNGEIDMLEYVGSKPGEVTSDIHTYTTVLEGNDPNVGLVRVPDADSTFYTYGFEWTEDKMVFFIDGKSYHTVEKAFDWPFDQKFYLMVNLAMGGSLGGPIDDSTASGWVMKIKSIKYYPLKQK